jgi:hypothetical protein
LSLDKGGVLDVTAKQKTSTKIGDSKLFEALLAQAPTLEVSEAALVSLLVDEDLATRSKAVRAEMAVLAPKLLELAERAAQVIDEMERGLDLAGGSAVVEIVQARLGVEAIDEQWFAAIENAWEAATTPRHTSGLAMIEDHLRRGFHLAGERRGLLRSTMDKRDICLRAFANWMGDRSVLDATDEDIQVFLDKRHIGTRTLYMWLSHLSAFYRWGVFQGFASSDPTERIARPRQRRDLPRRAESDELNRAMIVASAKIRCWLLLAAYEGLRVGEIAGLRREDIIESDMLLRVTRGKGTGTPTTSASCKSCLAIRALRPRPSTRPLTGGVRPMPCDP